MRFTLAYSSVSSDSGAASFKAALVQDLVQSLKVPADRFTIVALSEGSILADVELSAPIPRGTPGGAATANANMTAAELKDRLAQLLATPSSELFQGTVSQRADAQFGLQTPDGGSGGGSSNGVLIGAVIGGLIAVVIIGILIVVVYRRYVSARTRLHSACLAQKHRHCVCANHVMCMPSTDRSDLHMMVDPTARSQFHPAPAAARLACTAITPVLCSTLQVVPVQAEPQLLHHPPLAHQQAGQRKLNPGSRPTMPISEPVTARRSRWRVHPPSQVCSLNG